jgi:hypothetical protein
MGSETLLVVMESELGIVVYCVMKLVCPDNPRGDVYGVYISLSLPVSRQPQPFSTVYTACFTNGPFQFHPLRSTRLKTLDASSISNGSIETIAETGSNAKRLRIIAVRHPCGTRDTGAFVGCALNKCSKRVGISHDS